MFWIIIMSFVVLIALAIVIYMLPSDPVVKTKKKKEKKLEFMPDPAALDTSKDWKSIAERWEKHNQSLQGEIEKMKVEQKKTQQSADERKGQAMVSSKD